jgi:hypothetical protein
MPARKFKLDRKSGIIIETTPPAEKAVCDEISKSLKPLKKILESRGGRASRSASLWPRYGTFVGVNPDERVAAMEEAKKLGVPTYFNEDGDPYFESRSHENKYLKATGHYHKNAGYGDVAPDNFVESTHGKKAYVSGIDKRRAEIKKEMQAIERRILDRMAKR